MLTARFPDMGKITFLLTLLSLSNPPVLFYFLRHDLMNNLPRGSLARDALQRWDQFRYMVMELATSALC